MISHVHKCIFVHIPKCGGTSLEAVIWPGERHASDLWMGFIDRYHNKYQTGGLQHLHADQIRAEVGEDCFKSYFKFAFIRNPFDKAVSQYSYMRVRPDLREFIGMHENDPFSRYLELLPTRLHVQWEPQVPFLFDRNGGCLVDFIGRYENLAQDAQTVLRRLRIDAELPHINRGTHDDYRTYYQQDDVAKVNLLYGSDLTTFSYELET